MKHTDKVKLAKKMAKRGASNIFSSLAWKNRKMFRSLKEHIKSFKTA